MFFSNGPGDPATADEPVAVLRGLLERGISYFGICFGNQLFGRALGFSTYKLKYGHRGINQPVMDRSTGKVEVTSHNHGFAVDAPAGQPTVTRYGMADVSHVCLNDDVVEGLTLKDGAGRLKAFSVQYHPEAAAGPHDAALPVRPLHGPDDSATRVGSRCPGVTTSRRCSSSAPVRS